ncbi:hypothetical protein AGABI2DRAFT_199503 [Agaricus bisporus var. bisporus H97]|uniref:hypothetical protein n=1 Tax=Agaricus bisporus var. bisporus (strain H97 / ATCC MYA-4626 / FGSC 10389) TaxID=936046 RepID=UPI00029F5768|nr:hypothetical protein AGABI2DRAFT_199503 [Agaricus bisporus var. bisporus H97]EKV50114.1 hypothetical protein AGABI2DRAFT_199503 [Agaricus bisporus var. bisporus H97]
MSSRLSSAQIIALGEYLNPDFDPTSLTVSQLLGVLGYHNVTYPTPYSKSKLVQLFQQEIKAKATVLNKERLKKTNSIASDEGITDGLTGKPIGKVGCSAPVRRSSRRLSKAPVVTTDEETSPVRIEQGKRRRSSAQPTLGGTASRRKKAVGADIIHESGSEAEERPVKKVGRTRKAEVASDVQEEEEPNAECDNDNNRPVEEEEEEDEVQDSREEIAVSNRVLKSMEVAKRFPTPSAPPGKSSWLLRLTFVTLFSIVAYYVRDYKKQSAAIGYCDTGSNTSHVVQELKVYHELARECNLENRTTLYSPADQQDSTPCPLPPLLPVSKPESCTLCPDHAFCSQFSVTCEPGYLLHPHPLLFFLSTPPQSSNLSFAAASSPSEYIWGALHDCLNGLPGLGSVALPPRCLEDPKRKVHIGALGRAIEITLGRERGRRLCTGVHQQVKESDGGEAREWGVELTKLEEVMRKKTPVNRLPVFEDIFNEAIQELIQWGGITIGEDSEGHRYLAHKTPELTWSCAVMVKARDVWAEWKPTVFAVLLIIVVVAFAWQRMARKKTESKRVSELVQIALDTLRNQEIAHHTDPVTAAHPYLSSLQLRDLILQDEHSIPVRRRLWDQVEQVVEGNANVRTNMEEVAGGDELRVWRWVGSNRGRRVDGDADDSSLCASPRTPVEQS